MKTLNLFLAFILSTCCIYAAAPSQQAIMEALSEKIDEKTKQSTAVPAAKPEGAKQQIRLALQNILEKNQFEQKPVIDLDTFLQKAQELKQKDSQARHIQNQQDESFRSAFYFKGRPQLMFQGSPDYATDLKGKKYIFISETSDHDQDSLIAHTVKILETLHKTNPGAKILLANEFSVAKDTYVWPILFADEENKNIITYPQYDALKKAASRLNIDILALDETSSFTDKQGNKYAKVGPQWVAFDKEDTHIKEFSEEIGLDFNNSRQAFAAFQYFLYSNNYGAELRNIQWGTYIKAVKDFYDIIVVYAGSAHLQFAGSKNSVPLMLNPKDAVMISLNSKEEISAESQQHYDKREKLQNQFTPSVEDTADFQTFDDGKGAEDLSDMPELKLDFSKPHFRRYDGKSMENWYKKHIRNKAAFENYQQQHKEYEKLVGKSPLFFPDWLTFDVYMD